MRHKQPLMVQCKDGTPYGKQPEGMITDIKSMVAWCKDNIKEAGVYQFVRIIPDVLIVEEKKGYSFSLLSEGE
jgi:hypothetical protein